MIYFRDTTDFYIAGPTAVTLGKFDGVHLGHQKLMRKILSVSTGEISSVVFTLNPRNEELIFTEDEQRHIIEWMGIDVLIRCPFVPEISRMSPDEFVEKILLEKLHAVSLVVGTDFRFGYKRSGDAAFLTENAGRYGLEVTVMEKECYRGREISSTCVRDAILAGQMELAEAMLGRAYPITGTLRCSFLPGSGTQIPTASLVPGPAKLLPPAGVYFSRTHTDSGVFRSVTNIGMKPTAGGSFRSVDSYLFDADEDLQAKPVCVELLHYVRQETAFPSALALAGQVRKDIEAGKAYFNGR